VTGFVGGTANKPAPISEKEVNAILQQMQEGVEKPKPKSPLKSVKWCAWWMVRSTNSMAVEDVNYEKNKLRVSVTIFGRATPVELDFSQIEKA
jgi:transcription termination/antitermination protein NusG